MTYIHNDETSFRKWYKHLVPEADKLLRAIEDKTLDVHANKEAYTQALGIKRQLCVMEVLMDDLHTDFLREKLLGRQRFGRTPIEAELYREVFYTWQKVCFPKGETRQKIVTMIPASTKTDDNSAKVAEQLARTRKKRVAAYARVSTVQEAQQHSLELQIDYYTNFITNHTDWEFAGIYSDHGVTGTSYENRKGFQRMIEDAKAGKIDLILTKSVSRFARNTVDSLSVARELKSCGTEVYFEKEDISSLDPQAELMFTIMSSLAQEESRTLSENIRWGKKRSMEAGKVSLGWSNFLGYEKGPDGLPKIVPSEAKIVRKIYRLFLAGESYGKIAKRLTAEGVLTPARKQTWTPMAVRRILINEKYKGDALLQKTYSKDFLDRKIHINHGERPQYYVKNSHPAIISPEMFDKVQELIKNERLQS